MKVYALKTHEPIATAMWATDEPPKLYATREVAGVAAKEYNETFHDEEPATVVEIEVCEQPTGFVPTPDELAVLVKHWVNEAIDDEYFVYWGQCFGTSDLRRIHLDWKRVNEIGKMLSDELTHTAVEEAFLKASQDFNRNHWIVFRYGTAKEIGTYQEMGEQCLDRFQDGLADRLASQVAERVFRKGPAEQQMSLLKTELKRYSTKLHRLKGGPRHVIELFGIDFPAEVKQLILSVGIEDAERNSPNTFLKTLTLEQGKAILAALDETARRGEDALKELVAEPKYFVNALGLDCLTVERGKGVRFSILPFKTAILANSCVILPVVHYLNADPVTGRYDKNAEGSLPPAEWGIRYLGLSRANVSEIESLLGQDLTPFNVDFVMSSDGSSVGRQFRPINKKARWKQSSELIAAVEKAGIEASNGFETKLVGKPGVTLLEDFRGVDPEHWKIMEVVAFLNSPLEESDEAA
jgi:hypothetical protein